MTQVAAIVTQYGAVLAADTLVLVGPPKGPFERGTPEPKVFEIGKQFGVLSFGVGPPNLHVPSVMHQHPQVENAYVLSKSLLAIFGASSPPPPMGLLTIERLQDGYSTWEVNVERGTVSKLDEVIICRGCVTDPSVLPGWQNPNFFSLSLDSAAKEAKRLIIEAARAHPNFVGAPIQVLRITNSGVIGPVTEGPE